MYDNHLGSLMGMGCGAVLAAIVAPFVMKLFHLAVYWNLLFLVVGLIMGYLGYLYWAIFSRKK